MRLLAIAAALFTLAPLLDGADAPRKAVDDEGKEFTLPANWPADHPLPQVKNNCVRCHVDKGGALSKSVFDFANSSHDHEMLACDTCHGGDTKDDDKAHEGDFISGALSKLMDKCGDCHKTEAKIFNKSAHFSKQIKWDHPICSNCHDNHSVGKGDFSLAKTCTSCHGAKAQATTGEGESQIIWKSRVEGAAGNAVSVELLAAAPNQSLGVEFRKGDGVEVTVKLATDAAGKPVSTAEAVLDAIKADKELYYLMSAEEGGDSLGEGVVQPAARFALSGGADFDAKFPAYGEVVRASDALWDSLNILRKDRSQIPPALDEKIAGLRKGMMSLVHESPKELDPAQAKSLAERASDLKKEIESSFPSKAALDTAIPIP